MASMRICLTAALVLSPSFARAYTRTRVKVQTQVVEQRGKKVKVTSPGGPMVVSIMIGKPKPVSAPKPELHSKPKSKMAPTLTATREPTPTPAAVTAPAPAARRQVDDVQASATATRRRTAARTSRKVQPRTTGLDHVFEDMYARLDEWAQRQGSGVRNAVAGAINDHRELSHAMGTVQEALENLRGGRIPKAAAEAAADAVLTDVQPVLATKVGHSYLNRAAHELNCARGRGCFAAEVPVETQSGSRPIQEIRPGDEVWSLDARSKERKLVRVLERTETRGLLGAIEFADGLHVRATASHPFYVEGEGFRAAEKLQPGDGVLAIGAGGGVEAVAVTSVRFEPSELHPVYNLRLDGAASSYFANHKLVEAAR